MFDFFVFSYLTNSKNDSEAVAKCLDDANLLDKRRIVFDKKDWILDRAVILDEHTTVIVDDCTIQLASNGNQVYDIKIENVFEPVFDSQREANVKIYMGYGDNYRAVD